MIPNKDLTSSSIPGVLDLLSRSSVVVETSEKPEVPFRKSRKRNGRKHRKKQKKHHKRAHGKKRDDQLKDQSMYIQSKISTPVDSTSRRRTVNPRYTYQSGPVTSRSSGRTSIVTTSRKTFVNGKETSSKTDTKKYSGGSSKDTDLDDLLKILKSSRGSSSSSSSSTGSSSYGQSGRRNITRVQSVITIIDGKTVKNEKTRTSSVSGSGGSYGGSSSVSGSYGGSSSGSGSYGGSSSGSGSYGGSSSVSGSYGGSSSVGGSYGSTSSTSTGSVKSRNWVRYKYYGTIANTTPAERRQLTQIFSTSDLNGFAQEVRRTSYTRRRQWRPPVVDDYRSHSINPTSHASLIPYRMALISYKFRKCDLYRSSQTFSRRRARPCEDSSCHPATGNLLIGREKNELSSTSTCGIDKRVRYCIVSHLKDRKKCFSCDSRPHVSRKDLSHTIENIVSRIGQRKWASWWQSENGKENVAIQVDLEAEFLFTHLIITFKTFRPAAMLIERSYDFGQTWHVYRYFADDCAESFPGIPKGPLRNITDVICESRYSSVEPSTGGEVIFRVLPPNLPIEDPYSEEVQNLLKITNLRINFTKLHTLGDNLLDDRDAIEEKYYYSIYDMIVRGSCSCYGHASRCLATDYQEAVPQMVHGECECTHNTQGKNCEQCQDFYNELPWRPAIGVTTNACKRCNCNNHATTCHFDPAVYEYTNYESGGVCDDCQHNTQGRNCEECKPFYYHEPSRGITDAQACQPCDCDSRGSLDGGICDSTSDADNDLVAGRCHCKKHVEGRRCDRCKNGFWNFLTSNVDGCEACSCNTMGTVGNQGCSVDKGECTCKRYVTGRDCNQCLPKHWGLSADEPYGCKPCDCDPGGSYDDSCDVVTGECRCREHVMGRRCDQPESAYFAGSLDYYVYEAEVARGGPTSQVSIREPYGDRATTWSGLGFMHVYEGSQLEFDLGNIETSMNYDLVIRYEPQLPGQWAKVEVIVERSSPVDPNGPCFNSLPEDDVKQVSLKSSERYATVFPPVCLEKGKSYKVKLEFKQYDSYVETPSASILIDSVVLIPITQSIPFFHGSTAAEYRRQEFERFRCQQYFYSVVKSNIPDVCKKYLYSIAFYTYGKAQECSCDPTGATSAICDDLTGQCKCRLNIVGRRCDRCASGTYGFGPSGCTPCDCNSVGSLDNFCDGQSGQCKCRPNTYGRQCDECQPGYWNYPNCQRCDCNGHADTCDSRTGSCVDCRDFTSGSKCDKCENGFYGDPRIGFGIPCRPCPCPDTAENGQSHADTCELDPRTQTVRCHCNIGYKGDRCDKCAANYFGEPSTGVCKECNCNDNTDETLEGNCDAASGECLKCLFNTEGFYCERCKPNFYGDAINHQCAKCVCNILGTDPNAGPCNRDTGHCPCLPNVIGKECDKCMKNHWKIASGAGCESCSCDPYGSLQEQCNEFDGQCRCRPGYGGQKCDQCEHNSWGDPNAECYPCECNLQGSVSQQCDPLNGTCVCETGIGGRHCDECARGYTGVAPTCNPCGECFDNWDRILQALKDQTMRLVEAASQIKQTGATGAYTKEFQEMEDELEKVRDILANANVTNDDIDELQTFVDDIRQRLQNSQLQLDDLNSELENTTQRVYDANLLLQDLRIRAELLEEDASKLKENATVLQEADVEGALNITRDAQRRSRAAQVQVDIADNTVSESERQRRITENLLERASDTYNRTYMENEQALNNISSNIEDLENMIPDINEMVCDGRGTVDKCDSLCGGAGCDKCGSISCSKGAVTLAENALELAKDGKKSLEGKEKKAEALLSSVQTANEKALSSQNEAQDAYDAAYRAHNMSGEARSDINEIVEKIKSFLEADGAKPQEIRTVANQVLALSISLRPEQIMDLAQQINKTIDSLTDIDTILDATATDLEVARKLKDRADKSKDNADLILDTAQRVLTALTEAEAAQGKAQAAIDDANKDIDAAELDLAQIASETAAAQQVANKSVNDIDGLKDRLEELKKKFTENDRDVKIASKESVLADKLAQKSQQDATSLEDKYDEASQALEDKAKSSGDAKKRADELRERANKLAQNAQGKLSDLQTLEGEYDVQERKLMDLSDELAELNRRMDEYIPYIEQKATYYRECQN
ncbi:Laminin subunit beta-1 [Nymphon striatum]|nr:Laminin subunit beta-1 [Nymphon striatum]